MGEEYQQRGIISYSLVPASKVPHNLAFPESQPESQTRWQSVDDGRTVDEVPRNA